mmetsp:Transcript_72947/g.156215  ORF Transcript_72947/g.156215 Transcript_72947/m.156215 type:complete len:126 (-) Transcript_72947:16-393(-)
MRPISDIKESTLITLGRQMTPMLNDFRQFADISNLTSMSKGSATCGFKIPLHTSDILRTCVAIDRHKLFSLMDIKHDDIMIQECAPMIAHKMMTLTISKSVLLIAMIISFPLLDQMVCQCNAWAP